MSTILGGSGHKTINFFYLFFNSQAKGLDWDNTFKFGFVRNPYDRFVSSFFHNHSNHNFDKFVENLSQEAVSRYFSYQPQWRFLTEFGEEKLDFVGRFESLKDDWRTVCRRIGIDKKLPHKNKTNHKSWQDYYTDKTKNKVYKFYKRDFEVFGYNSDF